MNGIFTDIEKVKKENAAYDRLMAAGFICQGCDKWTFERIIFKKTPEKFTVYSFSSYTEAAGVLLDGIASDGQKIVTFEQIKTQSPEDCKLLAICNNGKKYPASYSAKLKTVFFTIPREAEVLGYIGA